jgi:hypothetical protein
MFVRHAFGVLQIVSILESERIQDICCMPCNGSFWCAHDCQAYSATLSGLHSLMGRYLGLDAFTSCLINMKESVSVRNLPGKKSAK